MSIEEERMSTCTYRCWFPRLKTLFAASAICWSFSVYADDAHTARPGATHRTNATCNTLLDPTSGNRYTLFVFFKFDPNSTTAKISSPFGKPNTDGSAVCVADPDDPDNSLIVVQGGCPADCIHPPVMLRLVAKGTPGNPTPGDPLSRIEPQFGSLKNPSTGRAGWGIFFADPEGAAEAADRDGETNFRVWQILVKDSCHAGRVLKQLHQDYPEAFAESGGYLGEMMIGSITASGTVTAPPAAGSANCLPWNP
jgi:hypothetical protein